MVKRRQENVQHRSEAKIRGLEYGTRRTEGAKTEGNCPLTSTSS